MNLEAIVGARVHPAIGIARIGNSNEFFIGPEVPHLSPAPKGGYRDSEGKLKRQAARFRIYGYDANGNVIAELTAANAEISWTVHVANKKAAWYDFDAALDLPEAVDLKSPRRNSQIQGKDREKLIIDPGPRTISGRDAQPQFFDTGTFLGAAVNLGELRTDPEGRLIFAGGLGNSSSPVGYSLTTFANNAGWHDDTSDGPVSATVQISGRSVHVDPGWVITAPPNYAPDLVTPQTMFDVIFDALNGSIIPAPGKPSFTRDILPLLRQCIDAQWVNSGFLAIFGWRGPNEFLREDYIQRLASAPTRDDPYKELRRQVVYSFRDPNATSFEPLKWPPLYGDAFGSFDSPPGPRVGFAVTKTIYGYLAQWMNGDFIADYKGPAEQRIPLYELPVEAQPAALDRAALHFCMGGPFHPGCEMTWPMRHSSMYCSAFRLQVRNTPGKLDDYGEYLTHDIVTSTSGPLSSSSPGDITQWMAVPWQSDTDSCRAGYGGPPFPPDNLIPSFWPSRVPNQVLTEDQYKIVIDATKSPEERDAAFHTRLWWLRNLDFEAPYIDQLNAMVQRFGELGIVERREHQAGADFPPVMYVETLPSQQTSKLLATAPYAAANALEPSVSREYAHARFPRHR
ncbi:MAG: LodA/GoxA family CTQ-dependent oxidase [Acidobacteriota bacterium]|nr:LodA/GoxA family CTQ-dependent oxidase [Acidobacteriota bacterium]